MPSTEPRAGSLYSCKEQGEMHGGNPRDTLPERGGEVTMVRFRLDKNPDGPRIIDHGEARRLRERVEMLGTRSETLPVYRKVKSAAWEYLGRYRVQDITEDARTIARRSEVCGRPIRYVVSLEKAE